MRRFVWVLSWLVFAAGTQLLAVEKRPNFLFILVDDLGYMDIGANNPRCFYETPHIDRLARTGMRFTNAYAACPVCSPTRYSIMTGKYPTRGPCTDWFGGRRAERFLPAEYLDRMPLEEVTLAEALRGVGYRTAFLGKWHLGPTEEYWPQAQGFEINIGGWWRGSPPSYFSPYRNAKLPDGPKGEHLPARLARETCKLLEKFRDEPFLIYLSFYSVHTPLQGRKDLVQHYRKKARRLAIPREKIFATEEQNFLTDRPRRVRVVQNHPVYAAMVHAMDEAVGQVLRKLEELGLDDNTVVFFFSDNGGLSTSEGHPTSNVPLRGGKGWLYEGGVREPCLIRWPGVTPGGSVCHQAVCSIDFYPTILEIAGVKPDPKHHVDGVSLVPLLRGSGDFPTRPLFWHYPHYANQGGFPGGAVRLGRWKLLERFEDGRVHLYDLLDDPSETNDLARAYPQRVAQLRGLLHQWYREVGARFLRPKPGGPRPWRPELSAPLSATAP